jgi:hypothetical protein
MHQPSHTLTALFFVLFSLTIARTVRAASPIAFGVYYYGQGHLAPADPAATRSLEQKAGRLPAVFMIYQGWTGSYSKFPWREARGAQALGKPLLVSWEPWSGQVADSDWSCSAVASGRYDAYLHSYAREARRFGSPLLMRLAHEMNGDWYPWATAYEGGGCRHNGNSPEAFVRMWRHTVNIFRQEGATNVGWVWSPNIYYLNPYNSVADQNRDLRALYPGDSWVDWIGLSIYNDGSRRPWRTFDSLFGDSYALITSLSSKPLMIAEMGVTEQGAPPGTSTADWIGQSLQRDIPTYFPRVKLVVWFCRDKTASGEANYRFDSSPAALAVFRRAVNSPLYSGHVAVRPSTLLAMAN